MNNDDDNKTSFLTKAILFIKAHPALGATLGSASLYVVIIFAICIVVVVLMQLVTSSFSTLFGVKETEFTSGKYSNMTLAELQETDFGSCYMNTTDNWFDGTWKKIGDIVGIGANSECELIELVKHQIKRYERIYNDYDLELSPGLVVSSIIYGYASQPRIEGEEAVDPSQPMKVLDAIAKDNIMSESDIEEMVRSMIFVEKFWYYNCEDMSCNRKNAIDGETPGITCTKSLFVDVKFSRDKFGVYLRYGVDAASLYELAENHNKSINYICDTCYYKWNSDNYNEVELDTKKYLISANYNTNEKDNTVINIDAEELDILRKEENDFFDENITGLSSVKRIFNGNVSNLYDYKDGFIYNKFPNYRVAFESGINIENEIHTPKTIEKSIDSIKSYEESLNKVLGVDGEVSTEGKGKAKTAYRTRTKTECPSDETCNCSNGNLRPSGGSSGGDYYGEVCKYLGSDETMIRLHTCKEAKYAYPSPSSALPGGAHLVKVDGVSVYMANEAITLEQYIKGVGVSEGYASGSVEGMKFQMLIAQSYLFSHLERHGYELNSAGEIQIEAGSCFQNYKQFTYNSTYSNGNYKSKIDDAYNDIKGQVLIDGETGTITDARYNSTLTKQVFSMASNGLTYTSILNSDFVRGYKGGIYGTSEIKTCGYTNLPYVDNEVAKIALTYVGKDTGRDCSGFVRLVLRTAGYTSEFSGVSCEGKTRGSNGMYVNMTNNNRIVWKRTSGINKETAMQTFPGNCASGDLIFYSQGNDNCVRHVAIYIGKENGSHMIADTTEANSVANYREMTSLGNNWIPLACARAY